MYVCAQSCLTATSRTVAHQAPQSKEFSRQEYWTGLPFPTHQLNGHELEQTLGHAEGEGSLVCCSPWGHKDIKEERREGDLKLQGHLFPISLQTL